MEMRFSVDAAGPQRPETQANSRLRSTGRSFSDKVDIYIHRCEGLK